MEDDSLGVVVIGDMNGMKNGGVLGMDMLCYAYYGVHLVAGVIQWAVVG